MENYNVNCEQISKPRRHGPDYLCLNLFKLNRLLTSLRHLNLWCCFYYRSDYFK